MHLIDDPRGIKAISINETVSSIYLFDPSTLTGTIDIAMYDLPPVYVVPEGSITEGHIKLTAEFIVDRGKTICIRNPWSNSPINQVLGVLPHGVSVVNNQLVGTVNANGVHLIEIDFMDGNSLNILLRIVDNNGI